MARNGIAISHAASGRFSDTSQSPQDRNLPSHTRKSMNLKDRPGLPTVAAAFLQVPGLCESFQPAGSFRHPHPPHGRTKLKLAQPITAFLKAT